MTLAELIIAICLLGLILLTAGFMDIASRKFFSKAEKGAVALNDISTAIEYMERSSQKAMGNIEVVGTVTTFTGFVGPTEFNMVNLCASYCGGAYTGQCTDGFRLGVDKDQDGIYEIGGGDGYDTYCYNSARHIIEFRDPWGEETPVARKAVGFSIDGTTQPGEIFITLTARDNPDLPESINNPNVTVQTRAYFRAGSLR